MEFRDSVDAASVVAKYESPTSFPKRKGAKVKMPETLDLKDVVEDIVSSFENRIEGISSVFDTAHLMLTDFQKSVLDKEGEKTNTQLRDILAKNEHLRRKDFDNMMQGILSTQEEREREVRNLLKTYFNEQKEMSQGLSEDLEKFKHSLARGEVQRVKEFQTSIKEILAKQDKRKEEITSKLKEFQKEQQEMAKRLKELLAKGRDLRIKDFKLMLKEFKAQHKERLAHQEEKKKEVRHLLGEFKKERTEAAQNWRTMQTKLAEKRTGSKRRKDF